MKDVVVEVRGGLIVEVYCDQSDVRIIVIDWDNIDDSPSRLVGFCWEPREQLGLLPDDTRAQYEHVITGVVEDAITDVVEGGDSRETERIVALGVCYSDGTWDRKWTAAIPEDTPDDRVAKVADDNFRREWESEGRDPDEVIEVWLWNYADRYYGKVAEETAPRCTYCGRADDVVDDDDCVIDGA